MSTTVTTTLEAQVAKLELGPSTPTPSTTENSVSQLKEPAKLSGIWDQEETFAVTPIIGQEFPKVQLKHILAKENADEYFKELATIVSRRNVVFFRAQDLTIDQLQEIGDKIHVLGGAPKVSGHHVHPVPNNPQTDIPGNVREISSEDIKQGYAWRDQTFKNDLWHSDITFEPVPSDYALLQIHTLPETGGDTLWASGYEVYDRLSKPFQELLEETETVHDGSAFQKVAERLQYGDLITTPRGHPLNIGRELKTTHPTIRTNPVTGWKSVFVNGGFSREIVGLTEPESNLVKDHLKQILNRNHDLTVRFKWNKNDLAIWDNRSSFHTATNDFGGATRIGNRVCTLGEKPYFDANSTSRTQGLAQEQESGIKVKF